MLKNFTNNERAQFDLIARVDKLSFLPLTSSNSEIKLYQTIKNRGLWKDNSLNTINPPDFLCDTYNLMGEFMQVDDIGYYKIDKKHKKYINKRRQNENKMFKEACLIFPSDCFPNAKDFYAITDYASDEQCFNRYVDEFKRIVEQHMREIPKYRKNHPNYKLIFFIIDDSGLYFEPKYSCYNYDYIKTNPYDVEGQLHIPFLDKYFIDILSEKDIDFIVWYKFSHNIKTNEKPVLPSLAIIDMNKVKKIPFVKYNHKKIINTNVGGPSHD